MFPFPKIGPPGQVLDGVPTGGDDHTRGHLEGPLSAAVTNVAKATQTAVCIPKPRKMCRTLPSFSLITISLKKSAAMDTPKATS
jgi:hypothetical protein